MATVTTPNQNLSGSTATFPASGQVQVGKNLAGRHIDTLLNLPTAALNDTTLEIFLELQASYDPANPPAANSWVSLRTAVWRGGQVDRAGARILPRLDYDTSSDLPEWARQRVTANQNINNVSLTATVN